MSGVDIQDLTTVVIGKRTSKSGSNAGNKKQPGVVGIKGTLESGVARKLDDNEVKAPDTVGPKVGKAIMKGRESKGWDQKDLASSLNITRNVVVDLERGTHKQDNKLLQRLEKTLGIWLTGDSSRIGNAKAEKEKEKKASQSKVIGKKKVEGKEAVAEKVKTTHAAEDEAREGDGGHAADAAAAAAAADSGAGGAEEQYNAVPNLLAKK